MRNVSSQRQLSLLSLLMLASTVYAGIETPTQYTVTLSKVEFSKTPQTPAERRLAQRNAMPFIPYAKGSIQVDIASVSPGQPCSQLQPTGQLNTGSYDQIRFTLARTMVVAGRTSAPLSNGVTCRTTSTGALIQNPFGDGSVSEAYLGATDGGTPEPQTVIVPTGTAVTLPTGFVIIGSSFQATMPVSMRVVGSVPQGTISFNVTNAIDFEPLGLSQCLVFPAAPSITISVG